MPKLYETVEERKDMAKQPFKLVLSIGAIMIILACLFRFGPFSRGGTEKISTSSTLTEVIDIAELSTAEFTYRGIAEVYTNENKDKIKCRICYNAVVKTSIDMNTVKFEVDADKKTVTASLPDINVKAIIVDEQSMAVLPSDTKINIDEMLKCSLEDAENEARESEELMATSRENLKSSIEGLLFPILKPQGYSLIWA